MPVYTAQPVTVITSGSSGQVVNPFPGTVILKGGGIIPSGGQSGQVLAKVDNGDFDLHWIDQQGGGGTTVTGTFTSTGDGVTLQYLIPHNLGVVPTSYTADSQTQDKISDYSADSVNIIVNFGPAPALGSPVIIGWTATP